VFEKYMVIPLGLQTSKPPGGIKQCHLAVNNNMDRINGSLGVAFSAYLYSNYLIDIVLLNPGNRIAIAVDIRF
jgi:hypothetical protein